MYYNDVVFYDLGVFFDNLAMCDSLFLLLLYALLHWYFDLVSKCSITVTNSGWLFLNIPFNFF